MSRVSEPKPKSFEISKWAVWEAYRRVKANKGGAGVDGESMAEFEQDLHGNLYKLWNRLSSGSYFPPPVRAVQIPKRDGSSRTLGVPTVADRIAQTVVRGYLEPDVEPDVPEPEVPPAPPEVIEAPPAPPEVLEPEAPDRRPPFADPVSGHRPSRHHTQHAHPLRAAPDPLVRAAPLVH